MEVQLSSGITINYGKPTEAQQELISQYVMPGGSLDDMITLPFLASNNLLWHSNGAWTLSSVAAIGNLLKGRSFIVDHKWSKSEAVEGFIYDASVVYSQECPDGAMDVAGMGEVNRYIVERLGYASLIVNCAFQADIDFVDSAMHGRVSGVSTGLLSTGIDSYVCPICTERYGREVGFYEKDSDGLRICPHDIPTPFMLWWFGEDNPDMNFAPFYWRRIDEATGYGVELSAVTLPDLPLAGLITPERMKYL